MIIFSYDALPVNVNFGAGLNVPAAHAPEHPGRRKQFTTLDQAWAAGFTAGQEDGPLALPPLGLDDDAVWAWLAGHDAAVSGADDSGDWDAGQLEMMAETAELQELHERGLRVF